MASPETRPSLLLRIRDPQDAPAWEEFSTMYRPIVKQMACNHGMQTADAEDLAQQVLWAISKAIETFEHDHRQAKFRTWLKTIARRAIINALTRPDRDRAVGGDEMLSLLHQQPSSNAATQTLLLEYRREVFQQAALQIREEFQADTWDAFWQTAVLQQSVDDVAKRFNRSRGSIYTARSRVLKRLKQQVDELDLCQEHPE